MPQCAPRQGADAQIAPGMGKASRGPSPEERPGSARELLRYGVGELVITDGEDELEEIHSGSGRSSRSSRKSTPPDFMLKKSSGADKWAFDSHAHAAIQVQCVFRGYLGREKFRHAEQTFVNEEVARQVQRKLQAKQALRATRAREQAELLEEQRRMKLELEEMRVRREEEAAARRAQESVDARLEEDMLEQQRKVQEEVQQAKELVRSNSEKRLLEAMRAEEARKAPQPQTDAQD